MTKKYKVKYWEGNGMYTAEDAEDDPECNTLEIEVLSWAEENCGGAFLAAMDEARVKILDDLAIDYTVEEVKP